MNYRFRSDIFCLFNAFFIYWSFFTQTRKFVANQQSPVFCFIGKMIFQFLRLANEAIIHVVEDVKVAFASLVNITILQRLASSFIKGQKELLFKTYGACETTRDFSKRYSCNCAPMTRPFLVNIMSRYFPNRDELSLIAVLAFPNASINGFTWSIFSSKHLVGAFEI